MTTKPDKRLYETLAAMARGCPLHKIEALCEKQKTVACSVLARMVEEAQDINKDYALTIRYSHEAARAADKARIAELEDVICELIDGTGTSPSADRKYGRARAALSQQGKEGET